MGVKCQHEIIRCLKAFMNNKVRIMNVSPLMSKYQSPLCCVHVSVSHLYWNVAILPELIVMSVRPTGWFTDNVLLYGPVEP